MAGYGSLDSRVHEVLYRGRPAHRITYPSRAAECGGPRHCRHSLHECGRAQDSEKDNVHLYDIGKEACVASVDGCHDDDNNNHNANDDNGATHDDNLATAR